jgi:hypothetical protein
MRAPVQRQGRQSHFGRLLRIAVRPTRADLLRDADPAPPRCPTTIIFRASAQAAPAQAAPAQADSVAAAGLAVLTAA